LLDRAHAAAVQASQIVDAVPGSQRGAGIDLATCVLRAASFSSSVSLALFRGTTGAPDAALHEWSAIFHPAAGASADGEDGEREPMSPAGLGSASHELERTPPRPVPGLGSEAYWIGNSAFGALYVLVDHAYFRISVGGAGPLDTKLERSRQLAGDVLERLPDFLTRTTNPTPPPRGDSQ